MARPQLNADSAKRCPQAVGARPELPVLARRARTPCTATFVIDLTMLLSVRRLTNEATGELLSLVEVRGNMTATLVTGSSPGWRF